MVASSVDSMTTFFRATTTENDFRSKIRSNVLPKLLEVPYSRTVIPNSFPKSSSKRTNMWVISSSLPPIKDSILLTYRLSFPSKHPSLQQFPFPVIQIFSRNIMERVFSDKWMKNVVTNDETFDHWFVSRALEPFPLGEFLGVRGKKLLFNVRYLYGKNNLYMSCQGSKVLVRKSVSDELLVNPSTFEQLWKPARVLCSQSRQKSANTFWP